MRARPCIVVVVLALASAARIASGDPAPALAEPPVAPLDLGGHFLHLRSPAHVTTQGGSELDVAPGYYVDEPTWQKLDDKYRLLEDDVTRKDAENKTLREKMSTWQPGWKTLAVTLVTGIAAGVYLRGKL